MMMMMIALAHTRSQVTRVRAVVVASTDASPITAAQQHFPPLAIFDRLTD